MKFNILVKVRNLGIIDNAEIELNSMTIFAGLNNTGKSYVSKFLYSFLDTLSLDVGHAYLEANMKDVYLKSKKLHLPYFELASKSTENISIINWHKLMSILLSVQDELYTIREEVSVLLRSAASNKIEDELNKIIKKKLIPIRTQITKIKSQLNETRTQFSKLHKGAHVIGTGIQTLTEFQDTIEKLINYKNIYTDLSAMKETYEDALTYNLVHNFQMREVSQLIGKDSNNEAKIEMQLLQNEKDKIICRITPDGEVILDYDSKNKHSLINLLRDFFSDVIYLESPLYWKLEGALKNVGDYTPNHFTSDKGTEALTGVPKYFYDLVKAMKPTRTGKANIILNLEDIVGGKIERNAGRELVYREKRSNKSHTLPLTATGVVQLAFLEHLVETQVIRENSVLFFDEPEAHLHPTWQAKMMKSLLELSKQGVNIILASHSPDNIQWLRNKLAKESEIHDGVGINHFKYDEDIILEKDKNIACDAILEELTESFAEEYYNGL